MEEEAAEAKQSNEERASQIEEQLTQASQDFAEKLGEADEA